MPELGNEEIVPVGNNVHRQSIFTVPMIKEK
jgi:hypothetical protein